MRALFTVALIGFFSLGYSQINFSRYLQEAFIPGVNPEEYPDVEFKWNMEGKTQAYMNEGLFQLKEKNYPSASENFKEVIKLSRHFWPAYYYLGVSNKAQGDLDGAEKNLSKSLKISPQWQTYHQLGDYYQIKKSFLKASENYQQAIEINPKAVQPTYQLGNVEFAQGNSKKALKLYQKCNVIDADFALAYVMQGLLKLKEDKRNTESMSHFNQALDKSATCKEALFWRGFLFLGLNEPQKTLTDWGKLVELNPEVPFFRVMRAFLAIELNDYDLAFNDLRKGITAYSEDQDAFRGGQTLLDKRIDIQYATNYAMRFAYGLSPDAFSYFKKGFCLFIADKIKLAIPELKNAERIEKAAPIFLMEALAYEYLPEPDSAYFYYDQALMMDKDIFDAHKKRGLYRFLKKDYKGAYHDFAEMIRIQPELMISYRLRGLVKFEQGDFTGSMIDFTRYLKNDSTDHEIHFKRGVSFSELKDHKNAIADFKKAIELDQKQYAYYHFLSESYLHLGDTVSGYKTLGKIIELFPNQITSYTSRANLFIAQKRWKEALNDVNLAITSLGTVYYDRLTMSDLLFLKGYIFFISGDYESSIDSFSKSLKEDLNNDSSKYYRGKAYQSIGKKKDARQDFKELSSKNYLDSRQLFDSLK